MDLLIAPSQESSKSVSIYGYLPSYTPPVTTTTVLAPTPSLPDRKSGGQSHPLHSLVLLLSCAELFGEP